MNFGPPRDPIDTTFVDNIFVFAGAGASWGSEPSAERGNGGTEIDMSDPERLAGYKLCDGSPAIGTGRDGNNDAQVDFWGDGITATNIGAYGGEGITCD